MMKILARRTKVLSRKKYHFRVDLNNSRFPTFVSPECDDDDCCPAAQMCDESNNCADRTCSIPSELAR